MATPLMMPSLSPTMEEGVIAKWHLSEGDFVEQGTLICSIETDKTTVDYESLDEGYLRKILVQNGETAKVNKLIAILTDEKDEPYEDALAKAKDDNNTRLSASATPAPEVPASATAAPIATPAPVAQPVANPVAKPAATATSSSASTSTNAPVKASPLARKIAQGRGIPLAQITGTGPGGRIIQADVEGYKPSVAAVTLANAGSSVAKASKPNPADMPAKYGSIAPAAPTQDVAINQMRKIIGTRLLQSWTGAPSFFVGMKFEMDKLLALRSELNQHPGYKISVNDLVVKCVAYALRQVPKVNATFHGDFIRYHQEIDISIAVAINDGLITPIVKNADQKALGQISAEVKALATKAQAGSLAPEEFQGGTFTISNLGMYGVTRFTSIINPPQACILAVAGVQDELVRAKDGSIQDRKVMECTLTADHRVVDGALAAQFMQALKNLVENPSALML